MIFEAFIAYKYIYYDIFNSSGEQSIKTFQNINIDPLFLCNTLRKLFKQY